MPHVMLKSMYCNIIIRYKQGEKEKKYIFIKRKNENLNKI